jgi:hypothetical protein
MKRKLARLSLSRETLHALEEPQLTKVAGLATLALCSVTIACTVCKSICHVTC